MLSRVLGCWPHNVGRTLTRAENTGQSCGHKVGAAGRQVWLKLWGAGDSPVSLAECFAGGFGGRLWKWGSDHQRGGGPREIRSSQRKRFKQKGRSATSPTAEKSRRRRRSDEGSSVGW